MFRSSMRSSSGIPLFTSLSMFLILKIIKIFKKYYHPSWLCGSICLVIYTYNWRNYYYYYYYYYYYFICINVQTIRRVLGWTWIRGDYCCYFCCCCCLALSNSLFLDHLVKFFWNPSRFKTYRVQLKCNDTRAETRFRLSAKRTSPFKSTRASVQSTTGSRSVRISGSNDGCAMFQASVKGSGYTFHSLVSSSLPPPLGHRVPLHFNWSLRHKSPSACFIIHFCSFRFKMLPVCYGYYWCYTNSSS